jgi:hypothetical protein
MCNVDATATQRLLKSVCFKIKYAEVQPSEAIDVVYNQQQ